jgi:endonuclease IV
MPDNPRDNSHGLSMQTDYPIYIHFSDIAFANRNETKLLPGGEGTLRVGPLRATLAQFERPATIISESVGEVSPQAIRAVLDSGGTSSVSRAS